MEDSQLFSLLRIFLVNQGIKIDFKELKFQLLSHPSYPSLHSVTGVLAHFNIENAALQVSVEKETIDYLPEHFITLLKGAYAVVTKTKDSMWVYSGSKRKEKVTFDRFLEQWSGIVVGIEERESFSDGPKSGSRLFTMAIYAITLVFIGALFLYSDTHPFRTSHFMLSLTGLVLSLLIVHHELGFQSDLLGKFCNAGGATSCDAVLNSKGARLFEGFKLSDVSLIYFLGLTLTWLVSAPFQHSYSSIVLLTVLAFPITLYSIYHQSMVIKKWCPLCLGIVVVLWLQCLSLVWAEKPLINLVFDLKDLALLFLGFLLSISTWLFVRPLLADRKSLAQLKIAHHKFKRNFEIFHTMLHKKEYIDMRIEGLEGREIVLGKRGAPLDIMVVSSPGCFYCKAAHTDLERILDQNQDAIQLTVRFNVSVENRDYVGYRIVSRLLELYNTVSEEQCRKAMHEVYLDTADFGKWLSKWGEPKDSTYDSLLLAQQNWCRENGVNFTPAILVNGREFPKEYERNDLSYFIEDLEEEMKTGKEADETRVLETL